jgi:hypothetical protein
MDMFLFFSVAARGVHDQREGNGERREAEGGERGERREAEGEKRDQRKRTAVAHAEMARPRIPGASTTKTEDREPGARFRV